MNKTRCGICPHECDIPEGKRGICTSRKNIGGEIIPEAYGKITAIALDPIEKKPLRMFHPNAMILSVGSYGCNFHCGFCQNHEIAMPHGEINTRRITPAELAQLAREAVPQGNIGVAYTYNEPLINYEFIHDCAREIRNAGLKNILVTNGYINEKPLESLLPHIDAMNIDLKSFTPDFYKKIGGDLETVKRTIKTAHKFCHIEITTLVIPNENENDIEPIAQWLSAISPDIPLHISRFFPRNKYLHHEPTPQETLCELKRTAQKYLKNVF
ncbi:MAG: AmmeMemoRadiSam system radical SAM enzyme [Defluviitaleaceae bacterium]|nr:AmmeMemoRadiSam system radical SAM enzyme [Defluviitaleaceae bacterium]MCL2264161.1 AmmeMemoRadiSam system radical SAM enzyme [Defluviitaleaceae bacterium]